MGLDQERQRVQDDLRGLVQGEAFCGDIYLQMYATDASVYELQPLAIVRPRTTRDVVAVVNYARENELTVHPRGGGSGLAGGCLGNGIVIDFSRYMRRILQVHPDAVTVQPGVVMSRIESASTTWRPAHWHRSRQRGCHDHRRPRLRRRQRSALVAVRSHT